MKIKFTKKDMEAIAYSYYTHEGYRIDDPDHLSVDSACILLQDIWQRMEEECEKD